MTVDTPDWVGMTALHHGKLVLFNSGTQVIAPGATYNPTSWITNKPGYFVYLDAQMAAVAALPYVEIDVMFRDSVTGDILEEQRWVAPAGTTGKLRTNGRGPAIGDSVDIQITNLDTVQNVTIHLVYVESTHAIARQDWRSGMGPVYQNTGANTAAAPCSPLGGVLFGGSPSIPMATTRSFAMALYAGEVWLAEQDAGASPLVITINGVAQLDSMTSTPQLWNQPGALAGVHGSLTLPRMPCLVNIQNTNAAAVVCNLSIVLTELAS